jgi:hypothetical protein
VKINLNIICSALVAITLVPLANASMFTFSFSGSGITSSGTITAVLSADSLSGVDTSDTYEVTGITGTFTDTNVGISGAITGLYLPLSYVTGTTETAGNPVAFTTAGLSYDDLFFPTGNSPADCPGYPFSGGDFDVYGVAFNVAGGYVGEFFSNGALPGSGGPVYAAADANSSVELDNPNSNGSLPGPQGVVGTFVTPEPGTLFLACIGLAAVATRQLGHSSRFPR